MTSLSGWVRVPAGAPCSWPSGASISGRRRGNGAAARRFWCDAEGLRLDHVLDVEHCGLQFRDDLHGSVLKVIHDLDRRTAHFTNPSHSTRAFIERYDMTPTEFRFGYVPAD